MYYLFYLDEFQSRNFHPSISFKLIEIIIKKFIEDKAWLENELGVNYDK